MLPQQLPRKKYIEQKRRLHEKKKLRMAAERMPEKEL